MDIQELHLPPTSFSLWGRADTGPMLWPMAGRHKM
jgi:hypothetical protein